MSQCSGQCFVEFCCHETRTNHKLSCVSVSASCCSHGNNNFKLSSRIMSCVHKQVTMHEVFSVYTRYLCNSHILRKHDTRQPRLLHKYHKLSKMLAKGIYPILQASMPINSIFVHLKPLISPQDSYRDRKLTMAHLAEDVHDLPHATGSDGATYRSAHCSITSQDPSSSYLSTLLTSKP